MARWACLGGVLLLALRHDTAVLTQDRIIASNGESQNMRSPFQGKAISYAAFSFGKYRLYAPIEGLTGLVEFSPAEYATMGRQFEGEKNYNASPVTFLGRSWKLMLGTVHGKIYKIAPYLTLKTKQEANPVAMEILRYCTEKLGKPASQETGLFTWDTTDGNVILQTAETAEGLAINLFLTSRAVRGFKRR